jgi:hypothetical protein
VPKGGGRSRKSLVSTRRLPVLSAIVRYGGRNSPLKRHSMKSCYEVETQSMQIDCEST